ncbi:MAG: acyl-ACP--UDP-N-acetylglucosamine O-acyltransferase [Phycisphaerae bacterium]
MPKIAINVYIDPDAQLADDVQVGPNCYIGPKVSIGPGCKLHNNVTIMGSTTIGHQNEFYPNSVIGGDPQDLKFKGGSTQLFVGSNNIFRENVTVNRGTEVGGGKTVIGNGNLFMVGVHIGHDCVVEDHVIIANNALIGGHVKLERSTVIGGGAAIHHFATIGRNAMIGGLTRVVTDVPPFMIFEGNPGIVRGVNSKGLSRNEFTDEQIQAVKDAYKKLFRGGNFLSALAELDQEPNEDRNLKYLIDFMRRSLQGKYGRYLETIRHDTPEDIGNFYKDK